MASHSCHAQPAPVPPRPGGAARLVEDGQGARLPTADAEHPVVVLDTISMARWCRIGSRSTDAPARRQAMNGPATTAALTLSLTGPFARQGTEAAEGVRLWAQQADVQVALTDDGGSPAAAAQAYARWVDRV